MLEFRMYRPGDEEDVIGLFKLTFKKEMSIDFWRWRYLDHPSGGPNIMLAFDGDVLAGHYAVSWGPLAFAGEEIPAALSMTTMTHPDYRGRGLFETLGKALYESLADRGVRIVHGFPNAISHPLFFSKLGWSDIWEIPTLSLDIRELARIPLDDPKVVEAVKTDARFARLLQALALSLPIAGARSRDVLSWRIDRNPLNHYRKLIISEGDEISGYAIIKTYGDDTLDLVELRCADNTAARALAAALVARAAKEGRFKINTWCMFGDTCRPALEMAGFKAGAPVTYFGGRRLSGPLSADISDGRLWRLSMLDSDLY